VDIAEIEALGDQVHVLIRRAGSHNFFPRQERVTIHHSLAVDPGDAVGQVITRVADGGHRDEIGAS